MFPNLQNYYLNLTFQEIGKYNFKINVIAKTAENVEILLFNNLNRKAIN